MVFILKVCLVNRNELHTFQRLIDFKLTALATMELISHRVF